ncbi:hypothetical protein QTP88_019941 [Uroleucon formosanum]
MFKDPKLKHIIQRQYESPMKVMIHYYYIVQNKNKPIILTMDKSLTFLKLYGQILKDRNYMETIINYMEFTKKYLF